MRKVFAKFIINYLRVIAKLKLRSINPIIIGVGGASGKTTLSNFIYLIFSKKYKVRQGKGKNSETGIPLDILKLSTGSYKFLDWLRVVVQAPFRLFLDFDKYDVYVAEMGIDSPVEPKNMSYLLKIIKPQIAVLTNISYEHSEYFEPLAMDEDFKNVEEKILNLTAQQEMLLLTSVGESGTAVLNIDDDYINSAKKEIQAKKITVSLKNDSADFYINEIKNYVDKFDLHFIHEGEKYKLTIDNPLPVHFAYSFVSAIAVGKAGGIKISESISILENDFYLPAGRMSFFKGVKDSIIVDSSYNNATLTPILDLLGFVKEIGNQRRRVGIIGDMRELGTMSKPLHEEVARKILETLDAVILIGPLSQKYILPILRSNNFPVSSFLNFTSAKSTILEQVKPKNIVLVKGSQNTLFLERVVEMLLKDPKDKEKLCRRGEYWDRIREKTL